MTDYRNTTGTRTSTTDREVLEQAGAELLDFDYIVPPDSEGFVSVQLQNGYEYIGNNDPNRCTPGSQDVINPKGAVMGAAGAAVAGATYGGTIGSVVPVAGTTLGAVVVGGGAALGSLAGGAYEALSGALSLTTNVIIEDKIRGSAVSCVPTSGPFGQTKKDISFNFDTPTEPGDYEVDVVISATNTGALVKHINTSLTVEQGASQDPATQNNQSNNSNGGNNNSNNRVEWIKDNPVLAAAGGLGGLVFIRTFTESAVTGE